MTFLQDMFLVRAEAIVCANKEGKTLIEKGGKIAIIYTTIEATGPFFNAFFGFPHLKLRLKRFLE